MAFAGTNRNNDVFMYVSNRLEFGHLVNADDFNIKNTNPDLYEIFNNKLDWQKRYIHENYTATFDPEKTPIQVIFHEYRRAIRGTMIIILQRSFQPCPDVYWFPIVSARFAKELIELVEAFGQWSDGTNYVSCW